MPRMRAAELPVRRAASFDGATVVSAEVWAADVRDARLVRDDDDSVSEASELVRLALEKVVFRAMVVPVPEAEAIDVMLIEELEAAVVVATVVLELPSPPVTAKIPE